MIFIFTAKPTQKLHGPASYAFCDDCNDYQWYQLFEVRQQLSLFFIPVYLWGNKFSLVCKECGHHISFDKSQLNRIFKRIQLNHQFLEGQLDEVDYVNKINMLDYEQAD
jgi:hypothetical protein